MKKLIIFMILSSIFSLFASTSTTSTTFEFQAQKKRPSSGVNDDWKFSINIVDRFHNDGDVLTGLPDIEIAKDSLVTTQDDGTLTSNSLHLFDVIYQTNSFYYPMQIDVVITDFIESKKTENETADVIKVIPDIEVGYSFVEINNILGGTTEEDFNKKYGGIITAKVVEETIENNSNLHKYTLVAQVPFTDRDSFFRKIAIYSEHDTVATAEIKYTFPVSIRLDDPNSLENKSGTYVMTVKVEAKTDL